VVLRQVDVAKHGVGQGIPLVDPQGTLQLAERVFGAAFSEVDLSEAGVRLGVARDLREHRLVGLPGFVVLPLLEVDLSLAEDPLQPLRIIRPGGL
jgi:hypothetical protein